MDEDQVWHAIDQQRLRTADLLSSLDTRQWDEPSLCAGWTVRDVAAHLTLQQLGMRDALAMALRAPGLNRPIREAARRESRRRAPDELVEGLRSMVGSRRHNVGVTCREALIDSLVHAQDVAIPLGATLPLDPDAAQEAATRAWSLGWPWFARRRLRGLRLVATDTGWTAGEGELVEGTTEALLLTVAHRPVALERLSGPGLPEIRKRLGSSRSSS